MTNNVLKMDLSQLMMVAAQYRKGIHNQVVTSEAFVPHILNENNFLVMAGTEEIRNFLTNIHFSKDDISQIKKLEPLKSVFASSNFEKFLEEFKFTGDMWAMTEGEIAFSGEPLLRITSTLSETFMIKTYVLSVLNHNIKVASRAARMVLAARGCPVLEFGTKKSQHEAAIDSARSAYLAGFTSTSNVEAAIKYNIPVANAMSHMWVAAHENEEQAFQSFKDIYNNPIIHIDTYGILHGAKLASKISFLEGVIVEPENLSQLSEVRDILDSNGCKRSKIIVSGNLNEYDIYRLSLSNNYIDSYIIENILSENFNVDYEMVYDDRNNKPFIFLPGGSTPGRKQVFLDQRNGGWSHLLALENVVQPSSELIPLLDCHIKHGKIQDENVMDLEVSRKYCNASLLNMPSAFTSLNKQPESLSHIHKSVEKLFRGAVNEYRLAMGKRRNESI